MVTTSNVSTIQAGQYYNKDDYYSRTITQEDFWYGKRFLSPIEDDIPNSYKSTITPLSQDNYEQKINTLKDDLTPDAKKLAIDLTFSPPKSISIAMLNPVLKYGLLDAHNQAVKNVLTTYKEFQSNYAKELGNKCTDSYGVVISGTFGKILSTSNFKSRYFIPILKLLGLEHITFHDLRHTHATLLLSQKINPKIVQERLGHSTITLTLDTYSHLVPDIQKEAVKALDYLGI